jgi:hypothetical protein
MSRRRLSGSITVRLGPQALKLVRARAKAARSSTSDVVRALIEAELQPPASISAMELSRAWVGALRDANLPPGEQAREALETWDPDRR